MQPDAEYVRPRSMGRIRWWAWCWYKTLTLPRHIKRALRQPIDPAEFVEVQRPNEFIATCGGEPLAAADERREQAQKDWESGTALKKWAAQFDGTESMEP